MWFQWFLKGVSGLTDDQAKEILNEQGLICRWWQQAGQITPAQVAEKLTEENLRKHLDEYESVRDTTPFISLTAGVRMRTAKARGYGRNYVCSAQKTALRYATDRLSAPGHVFRGYVMILPKPAVELEEFAEDVRDINMRSRFRRFHNQGEVTAKVIVPSLRLQRVERWEPNGKRWAASAHWDNPKFVHPESHTNVRDVI